VGLLIEKEEREGVLGKFAIFFFLTICRTGEAQGRGAAMGRRPSGRDGDREVGENGEEAEGVRFPYSPRVEAVCGGRATVAGGGGRLWPWRRRWKLGRRARAVVVGVVGFGSGAWVLL